VPVTAVRPVVAQYDPAVHDTQLVELAVPWKVPATQFEHTVEDEEAEYVPDKQPEQSVDDGVE